VFFQRCCILKLFLLGRDELYGRGSNVMIQTESHWHITNRKPVGIAPLHSSHVSLGPTYWAI
jgi:hypothetical protein